MNSLIRFSSIWILDQCAPANGQSDCNGLFRCVDRIVEDRHPTLSQSASSETQLDDARCQHMRECYMKDMKGLFGFAFSLCQHTVSTVVPSQNSGKYSSNRSPGIQVPKHL